MTELETVNYATGEVEQGLAEGFYFDQTFEWYANVKGINATLLSECNARSPKHARYLMTHPKEDTLPMMTGRAQHMAIFEPHRFRDHYVIFDDALRSKAAKKEYQSIIDSGREPIKTDTLNACVTMAEAAFENKQIRDLLATGDAEVSAITTDHGVAAKARFDWLREVIVDLKTTASIDAYMFGKTFVNFQYHLKLGWYRRVAEKVDGKKRKVFVIVMEQKPPHDCAAFEVPEAVLDYGEELALSSLQRMVWCKKNNRWPGKYDDQEYPFAFPEWAMPNDDLKLIIDGEEESM